MFEKSVEVPFDEMLDSFVPGEDPGEIPFAALFNDIPQVGDGEADTFRTLADAINEAGILEGFVFVTTKADDDASGDTQQTSHGGMYAKDSAPTLGGQADWSTIELSVVCKVDVHDDPFDDSTEHEDSSWSRRKAVLQQILSCGTLVFDRQYRTHHYTIIVFGTCARVVRLDRAGAIFTEKFDYSAEPAKLAMFLWRFSRLSAAQRGHDPTASLVLPGTPDYDLMMACGSTPSRTGDYARLLFQETLVGDWPWWRITVEDAGGPRDFLVGKPTFVASGLVGRGTRGYVALDLCNPDHPIVFLKDCWRVVHEQTETEGAILSYLNGCGVRSIPTRICDGDVGGQETVLQDVWRAKHAGVQCRMKHHRHYRLVVKEVGIPLREFKNGKQLVSIFLDCLEAHEDAYLKAGVIHRDISCGNLLMLPREESDGKTIYEGLLIDWELSKRVDQGSETLTDPDRPGTWQFMSVNALNNPTKPILISDDLESFFHAMLWFAIRWLPHNCDDVYKFIFEYFDTGRTSNGKDYYCGVVKQSTLNGSRGLRTNPITPLQFFRRYPQKPTTEAPAMGQLPSLGDPTSHSSEASSTPVEALRTWFTADLHPIDAIFTELLSWFRAYYQLPDLKPARSPILHLKEPTNARDRRRFEQYQRSLPSASQLATRTELFQQYRAAVERRAKKLESHRAMANLLFEWLCAVDEIWPEDDKQPDQLLQHSDPEADDENTTERPAKRSSKRSALHEGSCEDSALKRLRTTPAAQT
ncbi:uncharacterized protein TRAVEDRAFT_52160 [Trametes versicolor FP-101664 SS1]|uniref:uncharacterized protein n=1 Tax=Trametes versicolor (strain FP-101664) TaxID=717944 RepID=UPI0004624558|nr:uncharacterized protein TRAVEDRAFT_52160 [Trametes versicolor FP-101664 SS1]EIW54454.1 hypothetical protein TRAVEDRAFT_52160 [Trametes versicolor FP-101664 SS1]